MRTLLLLLLTSAVSQAVYAQHLDVQVVNRSNQPLANVAVILRGLPDAHMAHHATMDQRDETFVPEFLVVPKGSEVQFPNNDRVMHHVYSFSDAKSFDLPLYQHTVPNPVRMDQPGVVVVGCNIHDQMVGHILVTESSYVAMTDADGRVRFTDLPARPTEVVVWQPGLGAVGDLSTPVRKDSVRVKVKKRTVAERGSGALSWSEDY